MKPALVASKKERELTVVVPVEANMKLPVGAIIVLTLTFAVYT